MVDDALDLAAVDVEFAGDGALAVTGLLPGTYRLSSVGAGVNAAGASCSSGGAPCPGDSVSVPHRWLLGGRLLRAVQRDSIGGGDLPEVDRADLGAPGLRAFLAVVRDPIVKPGNAVYGGCQWILIQPALMEAVG